MLWSRIFLHLSSHLVGNRGYKLIRTLKIIGGQGACLLFSWEFLSIYLAAHWNGFKKKDCKGLSELSYSFLIVDVEKGRALVERKLLAYDQFKWSPETVKTLKSCLKHGPHHHRPPLFALFSFHINVHQLELEPYNKHGRVL